MLKWVEKHSGLISFLALIVATISLVWLMYDHLYPSTQPVKVTNPLTAQEEANMHVDSLKQTIDIAYKRKSDYDIQNETYPVNCTLFLTQLENIHWNMAIEFNKNNYGNVIELNNKTFSYLEYLQNNCWLVKYKETLIVAYKKGVRVFLGIGIAMIITGMIAYLFFHIKKSKKLN